MTKESKQRVLDAFDALIQVENGAPAPVGGRHNSHGGSSRCDVCGHSLAEGRPHEQQLVKLTTFDGEPTPGYCPIGIAVAALGRLVPSYDKRDEWLTAPTDRRSVIYQSRPRRKTMICPHYKDVSVYDCKDCNEGLPSPEVQDELADARRERIVAAAILHRGIIFSAPPPARHHAVAHAMSEMGISLETQGGIDPHRVQGFVTSTGRFVEREAACAIARRAKQIKVKTGPDYILFSEDVW